MVLTSSLHFLDMHIIHTVCLPGTEGQYLMQPKLALSPALPVAEGNAQII